MTPIRINEVTSTAGRRFVHLEAPTGVRDPANTVVFKNGAKVFYEISDGAAGFEAGLGTIARGILNALIRDHVVRSSNGGRKVKWAPGAKSVVITLLPDGVA